MRNPGKEISDTEDIIMFINSLSYREILDMIFKLQ